MTTQASIDYWLMHRYDKVMLGQPKNTWIVHLHGELGDRHIELSIVHTSQPHGLLSWGWDGNKKVIIHDTNDINLKKSVRLITHKKFLNVAQKMCEYLNTNFPKGL